MRVDVYSTAETIDAHIVAQAMIQGGLNPVLKQENLASMLGVGTFALPCVVSVPAQEAERALEIIAAMGKGIEKSTESPSNTR